MVRVAFQWLFFTAFLLSGCPRDTAAEGEGEGAAEGEGEGEGVAEGEGEGAAEGEGEGEGEGEPDLSAALFDEARVLHLALTLPQSSVDALDADPTSYVRGDLRVELPTGDVSVANIGVRLKGEYNARPLGQKASFKLKTDEFVVDQELLGVKRLTLNGMLEDPSCVAERLVYTGFRAAGLPAPRATHVTLEVNGVDYGLYLQLETEDKRFVGRWFADNGGNIYEEMGADWFPGNEDLFELETNELANDRSDLTALFAAVDNASDATLLADVAGILDTDRFLRFSAWEGIVNQWDGYAYTQFGPNNYRLYHEPASNHFALLPWGMDMSMKPYGTDVIDLWAPTGHLLSRCVGAAACRASYEGVIAEEIDRFEDLDLPALADSIRAQIEDARAADAMTEHSVADFQDTFDVVRQFCVERPATVRAQLP